MYQSSLLSLIDQFGFCCCQLLLVCQVVLSCFSVADSESELSLCTWSTGACYDLFSQCFWGLLLHEHLQLDPQALTSLSCRYNARGQMGYSLAFSLSDHILRVILVIIVAMLRIRLVCPQDGQWCWKARISLSSSFLSLCPSLSKSWSSYFQYCFAHFDCTVRWMNMSRL